MKLRNKTTGDVVTESSFRANHRNISLPKVLTQDVLEGLGYDPVLDGAKPEISGPYESIVEDGVEEFKGFWHTRYVVHTETDPEVIQRIDEEAAHSARLHRDQSLAETDWTQLADVVAPEGYTEYRQALRDISSQEGFPHNINWPELP